MHAHLLDLFDVFLFSAPFLAIAVILVYFCWLRLRWRFHQRRGKQKPVFRPSTAALGIALQFLQAIYRPSVAHVIEVKQLDETDEDDDGAPDHPTKHFDQQLKRIRRGEPVDRLFLRR